MGDTRRASHDDTALVIMGVLAACMTAYGVYAFYAVGMDRSDFYLFYRSGEAWSRGQTLYPLDENPNLNPPLAIAALFAPLALLPYVLAQTVWLAAGVVSLAASTLAVKRALDLNPRQTMWVLAIVNITHAAFLVWLQGQVTWLLLYPLTQAWLALRSGRLSAAGLWLAPAIAVKPILALLALALPVPVWVVAGITSASVSALGVVWTGWPAWATWLRVGSDVSWLSWPPNASLWGIAARVQSGTLKGLRMADLDPAATGAVVAALLIGWLIVVRVRHADRRFALALLWMVLASPLGWIYYLPLAIGPFVATWPASRGVWLIVACTAIPFHMIQFWFAAPLVVRTLGCAYGVAALHAFGLWASPAAERRAAVTQPR